MNVYEVQYRGKHQVKHTAYFSNKNDAQRYFNVNKRDEGVSWTALNLCTVRTDLVLSDWIQLLESDAPGSQCSLTPQDLITHRQCLSEASAGVDAA